MSNKAENKEINTLNKYIGAQQVLESGLGLEPEGKKHEVIFQPPVAWYLSLCLLFYFHRDNGLQHKLFILLCVHGDELLVMGTK